MMNQETNKSKGYAFIEFANNKEFQTALNNTEPIVFGKQKLVFNLAKNKYESNQYTFEYKENSQNFNNINSQNFNYINIYDYINDFNNNNTQLIPEKENINIRISGKPDGNINNSNSSIYEGKNKIQKENKKKDLSHNDEINNLSIDEQIKYALKKMVNLYRNENPYFLKSKSCSYYCGPFLNRDNFESN